MVADETSRAAERVARESYGRLVALLAARARDVAGAEDALGEAFAVALRTWPVDGVPGNPDAWLLTAARRRQVDTFCRTCGIRTYARGNLDSLGGTFHAVSVPTLELSPEQFAAIPVRYVNGRDRPLRRATSSGMVRKATS